jgi:serine protease Do
VDELRRVARGEVVPVKPSLARKYFGLVLQDVDEKVSASYGYRAGSGVMISEVDENSPAAKAGLQSGMLISSIGRYDIAKRQDVEKLFDQIDSGSRVDFGISWFQGRGRSQRLVSDTFQIVAK